MSQSGPDLDEIAWRVLSDLCRPGGEFGTLPPEGLQRLISLRLTEEADRHGVAPEELGRAFTRAMEELTGAARGPRPNETEPDEAGPDETIDDL
jgi:hypothetical protein